MKRLLLAASVAGAALMAAPEAKAQIPVTCTSCPTFVQTAIQWGKELTAYANQLREIQNVYGQAQAIYWAFTNIRDLGTAVGALQAIGISNPLPVNPYAAQALIGGYGGTQGMLGNIGGLFNTNQQNLTVYQCQGSWACEAMDRFRNSAAGTQALAMQLYDSAGQRAPQILALQSQIESARTPAEREALTAQLTAANAQSNNQLVQAIAVQTAGQQQAAMREQQGTERLTQSFDAELDRLRAKGLF